ncbi:PREDICTED: integrator complex subunit 4-like [Priapulus caudatus]|uniref:Integrator complex subunit 4-like n=1 Tax=Priapulus caudatus TaxID=37621 RepID=A0ABM1FAC9_PRICU|nr:PREDICTED: integrator complex subunit 4-like [Priapulus caudatus]
MAALLKKRALAEYSQVIQEEPSTSTTPPQKKLRLRKLPKPSPVELDLQNATSSDHTLELLLAFRKQLPLGNAENTETLVRKLLVQFYKEKESHVRVQLVAVLGDLVRTPGFDCCWVVEDISGCLKQESSHKVIGQILHALLIIGNMSPTDVKLHQQLVKLAENYLSDKDHLVRSKCIELIGDLTPIIGRPNQISAVQKLLGDLSQDQDPRVRTSAFLALLTLHQRGIQLDLEVYDQVCQALSDDYEGVRLAAVKLIWVISHVYPEKFVLAADKRQQIRLVDDGFAKICYCLNDIAMKVRAEAAGLLGSLHQVSSTFLEQTLDKKLMSNMRRKAAAHERQKEQFESGEWASGNKWASDAPKELINAESMSIITTGACGAFVHGLEDEFLEVRSAAVDSMCELAYQNADFASNSLDFLVDMLNDEVESVRLNAINSLWKISAHVVLREDQLETVLAVLEDFAFDIREGLRGLLSASHLGTSACVKMCIHHLLANLTRYPQDRVSIWKCMQQIGKKHSSLVLPLVPELLASHPYFDSTEPDMDDPAYISTLILVFNAAAGCATMIPMFHDFTVSHYSYLRDSFPDLIPEISEISLRTSLPTEETNKAVDPAMFLQQTISRLSTCNDMDNSPRQSLLELTIRDLQRIKVVDKKLSAKSECLSMYLECQLLLQKALFNRQGGSSGTGFSLQQNATASVLAEKVMKLTHRIETLFMGLTMAEVCTVKCMRVWAHTVLMLVDVQGTQKHGTKVILCEEYLDRLRNLQRILGEVDVSPDGFIRAVFAELPKLDVANPAIITSLVQPELVLHRPVMLELANHIRQAAATIVEPAGMSDNALKFTAGLTLAVHLDVVLENVEKMDAVRLKVTYPDTRTDLLIPKVSDFRKLSLLRHRLVTNVCLSHGVWSEACHVEISIAMCPHDSEGNKRKGTQQMEFIELCPPVKVYVSPAAAKKS